MFIFKITPKAMEIRNVMFFCVVTLAWPLEMGKKSLEADQTEQPSHCSHLDAPSREEAAQLEAPRLALGQCALLGRDTEVSKAQCFWGQTANDPGKDRGGRCCHFGMLTWFRG